MKQNTKWIIGMLAAGITIYIMNTQKKVQQIALSNMVAGTRG